MLERSSPVPGYVDPGDGRTAAREAGVTSAQHDTDPRTRQRPAGTRRPDADPGPRPRDVGGPHALLRLQARAGNAAVSRLVAQRAQAPRRAAGAPPPTASAAVGGVQRLAGNCPAPALAPTPADPRTDPKFTAVEGQVKGAARAAGKHPPGKAEADRAHQAAEPPADDKASQAKAAQADQMAAAKPRGFDKAAFMAAVKTAIAKAAPQNLDDADKFATSGKADGVKNEVMGQVTAGKKNSAGDIEAKTAAPPDPSTAKDKPVTPVPPQPAPPIPAVDGAKAMPGKAPAEQTDLRAGPCSVGSDMAEANVSDKDLAASNEPQMQGALGAKQNAEQHAAQAPAQIRQKEGEALQHAQAGASTEAKTAVAAMGAARGKAHGQVGSGQSTAKAHEETERRRISGDISKIYDRVKGEVQGILTALDTTVSGEFERGEKEARAAFTAKHKADMEHYKDERYSGVTGWGRWTADLFTGLPKEANDIFVRAKALYEEKMSAVISRVADIIGKELDTAKAKIAAGRQEIKAYVGSQPKELQKIAQSAATDISGKFDQLESDVDEKQNSLVDDLAQKYVEARNAVDDEIKAEQAKNEGLVDMAKHAIGDAIATIVQLKNLFMGLLSKAAAAFSAVVAAPVRFITNFMSAVKQGFLSFADHILDHLKKGLQGWLFGQLAEAGITLPEKFDLMGILKMLASLLGLTWDHVKGRIFAKLPMLGQLAGVWETVQSKIEIVQKWAAEGITGIWTWIKEKVGDVKQMIFDQIKSFVIERVVRAGITWVLGMLNPAGALVKIIQALISVEQWIMERGAAMGEFIGTIIDAVMDVARGGMGGVPEKIEAALSKAVPLVISFLAGLLGLGGISEKVKEFFAKGQELVGKGIDWLLDKVIRLARPLIKLATRAADWAKKKVAAGKAWVKGKVDAGKAWVKGKVEGVKGWVKGKVAGVKDKLTGKKKPAENGSVQSALHDATALLRKPGATPATVGQGLASLRQSHGLSAADLIPAGPEGTFRIHVQRQGADTDPVALGGNDPKIPRSHAPNIGDIGRHGAQKERHRSGPEIHWLESEHIMPFRIGELLWKELGLPALLRGRTEDKQQTTIMLYKGAADRKTRRSAAGLFRAHADLRLINLLKAVIARGLRARAGAGEAPRPGRPAAAELGGVPSSADRLTMSAAEIVERTRIAETLEVVRGHAVVRTNQAIQEDYAATSESISLTHAARRGIPPGQLKPTPPEVEQASAQQLADVKRLAAETLEAKLAE